MLTLDYNTVIFHQFQDVERSKKRLSFIDTPLGKWINSIFSLDTIFSGINRATTSQLLKVKGLLSELKENYSELHNQDLSRAINQINDLLNDNISFLFRVETILKGDSSDEFQKLIISKEVLAETIETLYSTIRLLKRANQKKPMMETSQMAIDSSKKSVDTLAKVVYGNKR